MPQLAQPRTDAQVGHTSSAVATAEGQHRRESVLALLLVPFIVVGYHVAITLLKLVSRPRR